MVSVRSILPVTRIAVLTLVAALLAIPAAEVQRGLMPDHLEVPAGARVLAHLPVAGALLIEAATLPAGAVPADTALGWKMLAPGGTPRLDSGVASTGAPQVWMDTTTGERAVVALVDTGVAPVPALDGAIAGEIDFTGTGGGDGFGHGTFLASLIAGRGDVATGVAPGSGILSLKVGDAEGGTDLATVLGALQWLHGPGRAAGIRVATLALGVPADDPGADFLDAATAALADAGILVVTATGNDGPGMLTSPATSTGTLSAGAVDDQGTPDRSDDLPAPFSGTGPDRAGVSQPDVVASGVSVVGSIPADSVIARAHPEAVVEGEWFRGSGTSMATALTAGVAALVSSARPDLDGAAITGAITVAGGDLDAPAAVAAALAAPAPPGAQGSGKGEPAQGAQPGQGAGSGKGKTSGAAAPAAVRWTGHNWHAVRWTGAGWGDGGWPAAAWGAVRWTGNNWHADWSSDELDFEQWTAVRWTAVRWTSVRWTSVRWTSVRWTWISS
jgi:serine protease AprX